MAILHGRETELARLVALCRESLAGRGQFALITGEAGIGKTSLAQAVVAQVAVGDVKAARGWGIDDPGAPALWHWRRLARELPGLRSAVTVLDHAAADGDSRFVLADAVATTLIEAARDHGLILVLEDLHWADALSLDLLRRILPDVSTVPIAIIGTAREAVASSPDSPTLRFPAWNAAVADLVRAPNATHVSLGGLSTESVTEWLRADRQIADWVPHADELVRRTGGNPFYIRSTITELTPAEAITLTAALTGRPTWRAILTGAFRALPAAERRTVATAAVLAERLAPTLVADALDLPVREVSAHLATAVRAELLRFGEKGLAFRHALVREAVIAELEPGERAAAHEAVATALERTGDPLLLGPAAMHWSEVEGRDAARRCRDLAERAAAASAFAPDRGVPLAGLALTAARTLGAGKAELAERTLVLARLQWAAGAMAAALDSCDRGIDLAEGADRPDLMADFALVPMGAGSYAIAARVGDMCRRALDALGSDEPVRRARLLALLAVASAEMLETAPRTLPTPSPAELSAEALALAAACGDRQAELETIAARHYLLSYPQAIAERSELTARALALRSVATTTMGSLWGFLWSADLALQRGEPTAVEEPIRAIESVADQRRSPIAAWHALRLRVCLEMLRGDFDAARRHAAEGLTVAERVGDYVMIGMHHAVHLQFAVLRGDPQEILPTTVDLMRHVAPLPVVRVGLATALALQGDVDRARVEFQPLRAVPEQYALGPRWMATVGQIGQCAVLLEDSEVARSCHDALLPTASWCVADGGGAPWAAGSAELSLGQLARAFGDDALAASHFARGIAVDDRIGARPYAALGRLGLASVLGAGDAVRALTLAREAADEFRRLDMPGPLAEAARLCDRLGAGTPRPGGLSERELEVARLVARAYTNRQIAEQLFLSVRTVESHVRSALARLGLTSRTELALWVGRHEPPDGAAPPSS